MNTKKISVLVSVSSLGIGGNEIFVMNFFRHIDKSLFQVDFLVYSDRDDFKEEVLSAGSAVYCCPRFNGNKAFRFLKEMNYVAKFLKTHHYDIIHCHGCSFFAILRAVLAAKRAKNIKIISHSHSSTGNNKIGFFESIARNLLKRILSSSVDYGFSCSDLAGMSKYTAKFMHSPRYVIIRNAIEIEQYVFDPVAREEIREKHGIEDAVLIGNVGRLSKEKNQSRLMDIFSAVLKNCQNARLMIIGGGELEESLKRQSEHMGLADKIIFTGNIRDVAKFYSAMDVFVMPSIYEGLPFTAIEAQANGLRCVFSDSISRMSDITGESVFLPLQETDATWSQAIINSAQSRCPDEKLSKVLTEYDLKEEVLRMESYFRNLVG